MAAGVGTPVRARRIGIAIFSGLRRVAVAGAVLSALALLAAWPVFTQSMEPCRAPPCPDQQLWLTASAVLAIAGIVGLYLFGAVIVAAGGPRRRGRRWSDRHRPGLLQARGWLADGRIAPAAFDAVAHGFRCQEGGEGDGEVMRAAGGCLLALAGLAVAGTLLFSFMASQVWRGEAALKATLGGVALAFALGAAGCAAAGLPLYAAGRRAARRSVQELEAAMDGLARDAHAAVARIARRQGKAGAASPGATPPLK